MQGKASLFCALFIHRSFISFINSGKRKGVEPTNEEITNQENICGKLNECFLYYSCSNKRCACLMLGTLQYIDRFML